MERRGGEGRGRERRRDGAMGSRRRIRNRKITHKGLSSELKVEVKKEEVPRKYHSSAGSNTMIL